MMRKIRLYHPNPITPGEAIELESQSATHLTRVLRAQTGTELVLFNGDGHEYMATVQRIHRNHAWVTIHSAEAVGRESPLNISLCQGISKGERMDYTVQKAVELGVTKIVPLFTEHGTVLLKGERLRKKHRHWQAIAVSACEQCGRNSIPAIELPQNFDDWLARVCDPLKLILDPEATNTLTSLSREPSNISLLIGPEGGLSRREIQHCLEHGFHGIHMGPRILRTETAAVTALSIIQSQWGDLQ